MKILVLPDEYVKKVKFIASVFERDKGIRPSDVAVVCGCIDVSLDAVCSYIGHGICDGGDE